MFIFRKHLIFRLMTCLADATLKRSSSEPPLKEHIHLNESRNDCFTHLKKVSNLLQQLEYPIMQKVWLENLRSNREWLVFYFAFPPVV